MKRIIWGLALTIIAGGLVLKSARSSNVEIDLRTLLPNEISGWTVTGEDKLYDPETIFDYIDGAGEVYRAFNFKSLLARQFSKEGQPSIIADLFDMGSAADAYGIFTHSLEDEDAGIGQGATYMGGLLSFWKDRFFVSLYSEDETEEAKEALFSLAKKVASKIKDEGKIPDIVSLFPLENLDKTKIRYFHNYIILNYHFFVADENILYLDNETDAALGLYEKEGEKSYLLLVHYGGEDKVKKAFDNFRTVYMPDADENNMVKTEDGKWTAVRLKDNLLSVIFNALSDSQAIEILDKVKNKSQ
jgi:hypothetical protein